jgi:hypothetical protein
MGIGDVNADGRGDFVVSTGACATAVSGLTSQPLYSICQSPTLNNYFGKVIDVVGDVDADGYPDYVIGAPTTVPPSFGNVVGHAYLVSGGAGAILHTWATTGSWNQFGETVSGIGDVDGDGISEVLIGAPTYGQAFVYSCAAPYGQVYALTGFGQTAWGSFGLMSASLGDLDGDGWPDYVLRVENGVLAVKNGPTGTTLYTLPTPAGYSLVGLGRAGDTDGDGFEDVFLGLVPFSTTPYWFGGISSIPVGVIPFGAGCPQSVGTTARIGATRPPSSAQPFGLTLSQLSPGRPVGLIVGLSSTQYLATPLPWDLTTVGVPGCSLLASIDLFLTQTTGVGTGGSGSAVQTFTIPPGLTGSTYYAQWAIENPLGSATLGSLTRGLSVTIQ